MTTHADGAAQAAAVAVGTVNRPTGEHLDWDAIHWRAAEEHGRRLRQRSFTASQAGDLKKVRKLQKLMLRSRSNALVSVRRVTEVNAGRKTAGIDGKIVVLSQGKAELADWVQRRSAPWKPEPVKRVYIPKAGGRQRPLGSRSSPTGRSKRWWLPRWNPSGKHGSSRDPMGFGRVVAATTRSKRSF